MKYLICLFLLAIFAQSFGYVARGIFNDPSNYFFPSNICILHLYFVFKICLEHPGKCVYEDLVLSPGEEGKPKGQCIRFMCRDDNGYGEIHGCGAYAPMPNCEFGDYINLDAPYGECCRRHEICNENAEV
ncbi:uncharacterized protein LOC106094262 isoform X1 [Stomoxys calcitrans]|uniref:uncharacterized protein LOC106094262 isoform X1 n=1 Tax=Stomoxys calcitrans TaxID=35570 RepID=UPI0027E2EEEA|nr:uncharacterized protein LOC106094262 isoform X1 [Stomoxys calcitrans]